MEKLFVVNSENIIKFGSLNIEKQIAQVLTNLDLSFDNLEMWIYQDKFERFFLRIVSVFSEVNNFYPLNDKNCKLAYKLFEPSLFERTDINIEKPICYLEDAHEIHLDFPIDDGMYTVLLFSGKKYHFLAHSREETPRKVICNATKRIEKAFIYAKTPTFYEVTPGTPKKREGFEKIAFAPGNIY